MRWLCLVRRGLGSARELVEGITTELVQGLVQPHQKRLPGRGFLRDREIGLFRFVRFFRITILTLASAGMLRQAHGQALPHGHRTYGQALPYGQERNGRGSLSVERARVELRRRGLDRQDQQGGDQGQRPVVVERGGWRVNVVVERGGWRVKNFLQNGDLKGE